MLKIYYTNSIDTLLSVFWCLGIMKKSWKKSCLHKKQESILDNSEFNRSNFNNVEDFSNKYDKELFISKWDFEEWCLTQTPQLARNAGRMLMHGNFP